MFKRIFFILLICITLPALSQDTLRVTTWNSLNFPNVNAQKRIPAFRLVLHAINPDILIMQELTSQNSVDYFLNDILNTEQGNAWDAAPWMDGPDTDNMLFYNSLKLSLLSNRQISTGLRDISEYVLEYKNIPNAPYLWVYAAHLKAGSTDRDSTYRRQDAEILRAQLEQGPSNSNFMVMGDFNLYTSAEPAYQVLIAGEDNNGRCYDPVNKPGAWHNYSYFSKWHTQSTRTTEVDGGASGGMDDRFDFILVSSALMDEEEWQCLPETYQAYGNDGRHYNYSINQGNNLVVPDSIADALYLASDHLPVVTDIVYHHPTSVTGATPTGPENFDLVPAYPNPFNGGTMLTYQVGTAGRIQADVYNIVGQKVETLLSETRQPGTYHVKWVPHNLPSGVYFVRWQGTNFLKIQKIVYIM